MANVDPNYWFLDAAAMPRTPHYTSRNHVEALIDGQAYMNHLAGRVERMRQGDYFHITGWRVTPAQQLRPEVQGSPTFIDQIRDLIRREVTIRAMLWYPPLSFAGGLPDAPPLTNHTRENIAFVRGVLKAPAGPSGRTGLAVLDRRLRSFVFSAHHQKTVVLRAEGEHWAYVGGIDICLDRWDTPAHENHPSRSPESFEGWHDVQAVVRGPAVAQVWENFRQRWNDRTRPHSFSFAPGGAPPPEITDPPPAPPAAGTHHVQVLRTLVCNNQYPFQPDGEQTARRSLERAIARAQHYVYIEDQYVWPCTLVDLLRDATKRGVKVIFIMSHRYDLPGVDGYHNQMRHEVLERIRSGNPDNVYAFHLQRTNNGADIYLHSKLVIVDDCYAAIGSANFGLRSQTTDSELHLAVVDESTVSASIGGQPATVCRFARELRIALWMEHLGLRDRAGVEDPIQGLALWPACPRAEPQAPLQVHHAVCYYVPAKRSPSSDLLPRRYMNVETVCRRDPGLQPIEPDSRDIILILPI